MATTTLGPPRRFNDETTTSPEPEWPTIGMLLEKYETYLGAIGRRPGTIEQRVGDIRRLAEFHGEVLRLGVHDLLAYYEAHPTWQPEYRRKIRASLTMFYRWARLVGHIEQDPTEDLEPVSVPMREPRPTPDDVILDAFEDMNLHERAMLLLAATMGLRRTEIATLHPAARAGDQLYIEGKGGNTRILTLDPLTLEYLVLLEQLQGTDSHYFPGRFGGHVHPATVYSWVTRHLGRPWTLHNCRTRAGTVGFRGTKNLRAVQKFLGHRSIATTEVYVGVLQDEVASVANATSLAFSRDRQSTPGRPNVPKRKDRVEEHKQFLQDLASVTTRAKKFGIELTLR